MLEVQTESRLFGDRLRLLPWRSALVSGLGGFATVAVLAALANASHLALLIPPFGASSVLLFALPSSPLAQPRNVIGGHLVAAFAGMIAVSAFGPALLAIAAGVGLAIAAMILTGTLHPPAGANPIVVGLLMPGWSFLIVPVLFGTVFLVAIAICWHRLFTRTAYPLASR